VVSRIDLLPEPARTELRKLLSEYLDGTVTALSTPHDYDGLMKALREVEATGGRLLKAATAVFATDAGRPFTGLVIGPINDLLDQGLARRAAVGNHPPTAIFLMLYLVGLISAATSGVAMGGSKRVSWLHVAFFAAVVASVVTLTVDLEMPRLGIIRVTEWDALLREVAESLR
jgi:hypothetical protein